jgi:NADPH:quinone reductase-like Zn-dependent oxidoreductase
MKAHILSELVKNVWPKIEAGKIKSRVCAVFPIQEAEKAHEMMEQGRSIGKIVLEIK